MGCEKPIQHPPVQAGYRGALREDSSASIRIKSPTHTRFVKQLYIDRTLISLQVLAAVCAVLLSARGVEPTLVTLILIVLAGAIIIAGSLLIVFRRPRLNSVSFCRHW